MKLASVLAAVALAANASHAGLPVDTSPALDASVANVASPIPDTSSDTTANDVPQVSYPDEDCPNPKKVPHCCAHVRFRNKVARAQNCHAVVKQPGSIEGVGTACAKTSGWMAMCCKPNPRGKKYACELPRRGFWSGPPQYPDRGHSSPREEEWPVEAEAGATFHGDQPNWREETGRRGRLGAGPGSRQGSRGWGESGEWPAESKTGPSYSEGLREWTNEEEYGPRESDPRPEFGGESVGWTEAEEYRPREAGRGPETDEYRPREAGQGPGLRDGDRWSEDRYRSRERTGSRFRDDSSRWSEPDSEPEEYRPTHSEAGSGFRDWPRWTEEEYQPSKSKSQSGSRGRGGGSSGRGRGRPKKTGSRRGSRGGRWSSEVEQWE